MNGISSDMSVSSKSTTNDIKTLRKQLNSVAWVQCDNPSCLKWRKIDRGDAKKFANTPWHCSMNKDPNFNACSYEQEDTTQFDKLAKKAKLSVIKSDLRLGSLVWAKTTGYSSWPALITKDPANAEYCDGDEFENLWYHVEYIGGKRCHGWVRSSRVETFGTGKLPDLPTKLQKKKIKRRKKAPLTNYAKVYQRDKQSYKGQQTLQEAYDEAMSLLPLSCEARLKTCVFTTRVVKGDQRYKKKGPRTRSLMEKGCNTQVVKEQPEINTKTSRGRQQRKCSRPISDIKKKKEDDVLGYVSHTSLCLKSQVQDCSSKANENEVDLGGRVMEKEEAKELSKNYNMLKIKSTLEPFFDFSSSLIDVSKESRLMADAEKYRSKSLVFEANLSKFFLDHDLPACKAPVWCQLKISLFEFFLNVFERGGFLTVTARHQWSSVYQELTHQLSKDGGSKTKAFYKKNLYPYELYIQAKDYSCALEEKIKSSKQRKGQKKLSISHQRNDVDENDLMKELEELDDFLELTLEGTLCENKDLVTDSYKEFTGSDSQFSPHLFAHKKTAVLAEVTDGVSQEPQRILDVTDQKFPSGRCPLSQNTVNSLKGDIELENTQEWTIHELQLLENCFQ